SRTDAGRQACDIELGGTAYSQRPRLPPPQLRFSSCRRTILPRRFSVPNPRSSGPKVRYMAPTRWLKSRPVPSVPHRAAVFLKQPTRPLTCWPRTAAISALIPTRRSVFNFGAIPPWGWARGAECSHPVGAPPRRRHRKAVIARCIELGHKLPWIRHYGG